MRLYDLSPEVGGMSFTWGRKVYMDTGGQGRQAATDPDNFFPKSVIPFFLFVTEASEF